MTTVLHLQLQTLEISITNTVMRSCQLLFFKLLFMRGLRKDDVQIRRVRFPLQVMLADVVERKQPWEHTNQYKC